jgi:peptidoglycan hydrolase-like protein with peptidoglycan-binding domain
MRMALAIHLRRGRIPFLSRFLLAALCCALLWPAGWILPAIAQSGNKSGTAPAKKPQKKSTKKPARARAQTAATADRIREIQEALVRAGHLSATPTGKWDAATTQAMRDFQEAQGLKPTGKLDALTLQLLGLGSPVAGLAPPRKAASGTTPDR